jgi:hypothetical protein
VKRLSEPDAVAALSWLEDHVDDDPGPVHPLRRTARRLVRPLRRARKSSSGFTGYDPTGWDATVWVVHAMYETDEVPGGFTHDEVRRIELAAGAVEPETSGDAKLDKFIEDATLTGTPLGGSAWPGPGWRRLLWRELAARLDVDPYAIEFPPCHRSFPYTSWPANIAPPAEGSLDREQFIALLDRLAEASRDGNRTVCTTYRCPMAVRDWPSDDRTVVVECELRELIGLYEYEGSGAPNNIWPTDKSWFTYTDYDLWATKVSGSPDLIARILEDDELEGVVLDV